MKIKILLLLSLLVWSANTYSHLTIAEAKRIIEPSLNDIREQSRQLLEKQGEIYSRNTENIDYLRQMIPKLVEHIENDVLSYKDKKLTYFFLAINVLEEKISKVISLVRKGKYDSPIDQKALTAYNKILDTLESLQSSIFYAGHIVSKNIYK